METATLQLLRNFMSSYVKNQQPFEDFKKAIVDRCQTDLAYLFTPVADVPIPADEPVIVKCDKIYAVHVDWYSETNLAVFGQKNPISWAKAEVVYQNLNQYEKSNEHGK